MEKSAEEKKFEFVMSKTPEFYEGIVPLGYRIAHTGYEDINGKIECGQGNFFLKIYKDRSYKDALGIALRFRKAKRVGVNAPDVIDNVFDKLVSECEYEGQKVAFSILEFVDGKDFVSLGRALTFDEMSDLAMKMKKLNDIDLSFPEIYNDIDVCNYLDEYNKKKTLLDAETRKIADDVCKKLSEIDLGKLPKAFIHGDIHSANLMKDKTGKLCLIDFTSANNTIRISEVLNIVCSGLILIKGDIQKSTDNVKTFFKIWSDEVQATEEEEEVFGILFKAQVILNLMCDFAELDDTNDTKVVEKYIEEDKFALVVALSC